MPRHPASPPKLSSRVVADLCVTSYIAISLSRGCLRELRALGTRSLYLTPFSYPFLWLIQPITSPRRGHYQYWYFLPRLLLPLRPSVVSEKPTTQNLPTAVIFLPNACKIGTALTKPGLDFEFPNLKIGRVDCKSCDSWASFRLGPPFPTAQQVRAPMCTRLFVLAVGCKSLHARGHGTLCTLCV